MSTSLHTARKRAQRGWVCGRAVQAQSTGRPYFLQMSRSSRTPWSSIGFAHRVFSGLAPASQFGTSFMISASLALTFSIRYAVLWSDHAANVAGRRNDQRRRAEACRLLLECCIQQREPPAAKGSRRAGWDAGLGREAHRTSFSAVKKGIVAKRISSSSRLHSLPPRAAQLRG